MSVDFQEEQSYRMSRPVRSSPIITWMLNKGVIKDEAQGNKILLAVAIVFFVLSIYLFTR